VIREIGRRWTCGESLTLTKAPAALVMAARRRFGSWANAVGAAGLDYRSVRLVRPAYTRAELLTLIRDLAKARPNLRLADLHRAPYSHFAPQVRRFFGSFVEAAHAAGLENWPRRSRATGLLGRAQILRRLRERAHLGKPVYTQAVARDDAHLFRSVRGRYRTWDLALAAARLADDSPTRRWTRERIVLELSARAAKDPESVRAARVRREARGLYQAARRHFGSYRAAVARLGVGRVAKDEP
jgi:hypothetical protein